MCPARADLLVQCCVANDPALYAGKREKIQLLQRDCQSRCWCYQLRWGREQSRGEKSPDSWVVNDHGSSVANCFCVPSRCRGQITLNGVVMHSFTGMCCHSGHWDTAASKADRNPVKPLKPSLGSSFTDRDFHERNLKGTQDSTVPCRILPKARPHAAREGGLWSWALLIHVLSSILGLLGQEPSLV